ncbi:Crp/Fnr family transcriptional regulator [Carboxylicivirga marina]|uniref:Crp/Fnr family transcriptional regulator n=1 Tax=Carboxylicivirga marina TaxID=2800988 RepID=A0ABS1HEF8_9BACT|nr:Crp/Fnr family transcriptional regulator [Carboxylicivirga marina]MBK3516012.1 Crp/Fnr family transcriptional regulator [Carboxylicivirga marina]
MPKSVVYNGCSVGENPLCCFDDLTQEECDFVEENSVEVEYKRGENICKQGSFASHIMVMKEGLAKIYLENGNDALILKILPAINMIGLPALFEGNNTFPYSVQTYMDSTVKQIEIGAFKKLIESNAKFAGQVISMLAENTVIINGRFFCLTKKQTYGRLADVLLCLSNRIYKTDKFPLQLTRKDLAELSSMSVESTTRILTKFKDEGLIAVHCNEIEILNADKLLEISAIG